MNAPARSTNRHTMWQYLADRPGEAFKPREILDAVGIEGEVERARHTSALAALAKTASDSGIRRVEGHRYVYAPDTPRIDGASMVEVVTNGEWQTIKSSLDLVPAELISGTMLGQSKTGNFIVKDTENRIWEVRVVVEGRLL